MPLIVQNDENHVVGSVVANNLGYLIIYSDAKDSGFTSGGGTAGVPHYTTFSYATDV